MPISDPVIADGLVKCGLNPRDYFMSGVTSLRGPCIRCQGHRRMVIFLNGEFPKWFFRCDQCDVNGYAPYLFRNVMWPDGPIGELPAPEHKDYSQALATLREKSIDMLFHNNMDASAREWWIGQGIPEDEQNFYSLGVVRGRPFKRFYGEGLMVLDAYTIPKYELGWGLMNIDFRMVGAPDKEGKYRPFPGCPSTAFVSRPDAGSLTNSNGIAFVVEGAKKAIVTCMYLGGAQVVGVPSSNSWAGVTDRFADAEIVYVLLDADAWMWGRRMLQAIGPKARQVTLPMKIDDGFSSGALTLDGFEKALKFARREL